jgi:hypothetical protein
MVARYHRGALPRPRGKIMQRLELPDRPMATLLAGILRLSVALDLRQPANKKRRVLPAAASQAGARQAASNSVGVCLQDNFIVVRAEGYSALDGSAERVAAARHLLETVLRRPVLVRALRTSAPRVSAATRSGAVANVKGMDNAISSSGNKESPGDGDKAA